MDTERDAAGGGAAVAVDVGASAGATAAAAAAAAAAPRSPPPRAPTPTVKNGADECGHGTGKASGGTGGQGGDEVQADESTTAVEGIKVEAKVEKRRRASIIVATNGGKAVATIKGGADSWDIVESKALEHHRGTREWVFIEVERFCDLEGELGVGVGVGKWGWGGKERSSLITLSWSGLVSSARGADESHHSPTARADIVARGEGGKVKTLFWLMGGGGTGKSVTIAVVCKR